MPIVSTIGRKSPKVRILIGSIYAVLIAGSISMVYPFLLMLSGTTKSNVDTPDTKIIPEFIANDNGLYKRFAESIFNESVYAMQYSWNTPKASFRHLSLPKTVNSKFAQEWETFIKESNLPNYSWGLGFSWILASKNVYPLNLRLFRDMLKQQCKTFDEFQKIYQSEDFLKWSDITIKQEPLTTRRIKLLSSPLTKTFTKFASKRPIWQRYYFNANIFYIRQYLQNQYTKDISLYNKEHNTAYKSWNEINLTKTVSGTDKQKGDWEDYVRNILNLMWIRLTPEGHRDYQEFLSSKYDNNLSLLNKQYGTEFKNFSNIKSFTGKHASGAEYADWAAFLQGWKHEDSGQYFKADITTIFLYTVEFQFQKWLRKRYQTIDKLNKGLDIKVTDWTMINLPQEDFHIMAFKKNAMDLRKEFTIRNFYTVFDTIIVNGRAVYNTLIYCALAILCTLIVNPLAAYALSRYNPPSSYKILLFMMMTMAFPPMVTQIPVFLMLREFNLLNTFWAMILPGMANGYSIFLLKGFFDSLPSELYEAAEIDGAGEFRIFWQITMSLSKPILAVISLNAFTMAYSNFMMALLICQDSKMWTLMPWLYQLQINSTQGVVFASLVIAAIPTFVVFAFCQNIIMRGIVVPVEK